MLMTLIVIAWSLVNVDGIFIHEHHNVVKPQDMDALHSTLEGSILAVIQFGAAKCRHSNRLQHILNELPQYYKDSDVTFLFVDCHKTEFVSYCLENEINKFPTVKLVYLGVHMKTEYRGQRTVKAIKGYIDTLINNDVTILEDVSKLDEVRADKNHRCVLGFFPSTSHEMFQTYKKMSGVFHKQCYFYAYVNEVQKVPIIAIRDTALGDEVYTGENEIGAMFMWARDNCKSLVPEMTFDNAEEIIESKTPLLLLYRNSTDMDSVNYFTKAVSNEIQDLILNRVVIAVHVDGAMFKNALRFANMTLEDLPLVQIDTFEKYDILPNLETALQEGVLRNFVMDLLENSGNEINEENNTHQSIYLKLQPSTKRYSFQTDYGKDEL